jgi:hypothetical protein
MAGLHMLAQELFHNSKERPKKGDTNAALHHHEVKPYSLGQVIEHAHNGQVEVAPLKVILNEEEESCVDGRDEHPIVGVLGGDTGNVAKEFTGVERARGQNLDENTIRQSFRRYLKDHHNGPFYLHTDTDKFKEIAREMDMSPADLMTLINVNPGRYEQRIRKELKNPKKVGCGHVANMLKNSKDYPGLRPKLLETIIDEYLTIKWEGTHPMKYVVLDGEHEEGAILRVKSTKPLDLNSPVPKLQPKVKLGNRESSVFLVHSDVAQATDEDFARHAADILKLRNIVPQQAVQQMLELQQQWAHASIMKLTEGKRPTFEYQYDPENMDQRPAIKPARLS